MALETVSVGSSSSGNSYIIITENCRLILDVGLPAKRIVEAISDLGYDPDDVDAVLITHEHTDHVKSVRAISRKCGNSVFFASRGTIDNTEGFTYVDDERIRCIKAGECAYLGDEDEVVLKAFALSHDGAEPVSYTVTAGGEKLAVVTDTGVITEEIFNEISDADYLVLEANHDAEMLMFGEYPYNVKVRIKSDSGHLSNESAGDVLVRILNERDRKDKPLSVMLAHLSFNNNLPLLAEQAIEDMLRDNGFESGEDYTIEIAAKEGMTFLRAAITEEE